MSVLGPSDEQPRALRVGRLRTSVVRDDLVQRGDLSGHEIDDGRCAKCGYDLAGLPAAGRCPECDARYFVGDDPSERWTFRPLGVPMLAASAMLVAGLNMFGYAMIGTHASGVFLGLSVPISLLILALGFGVWWWQRPYDRVRSLTIDWSYQRIMFEELMPGDEGVRVWALPMDELQSVRTFTGGARSPAGYELATDGGTVRIPMPLPGWASGGKPWPHNDGYVLQRRLQSIAAA